MGAINIINIWLKNYISYFRTIPNFFPSFGSVLHRALTHLTSNAFIFKVIINVIEVTLPGKNYMSGGFKVNTVLYLCSVVNGIVGLVYASVPLYRTFCQRSGYGWLPSNNSITLVPESTPEPAQDLPTVKISFVASASKALKWRFKPQQRAIYCKPGQTALAFYTAENLSNSILTGVATYSIIPASAAKYFNKIQCFCFEEQTLSSGEKVDMPVYFFLDPEFALDPEMESTKEIILGYTFFSSNSSTPSA